MSQIRNWIRWQWEKLTKRFEVFEAIYPADQLACFQLRRSVFGVELKRTIHHDMYYPAHADGLDQSNQGTLLACKDNVTGKIIGTCRFTPAEDVNAVQYYRKSYRLYRFPKHLYPKIMISSRYIIDPTYRHSLVSWLIASYAYRYLLDRRYLAVVAICEPGLYYLYRRLGFRMFAPIFHSEVGGFRLPMTIALQDYDYLKQIDSPVYQEAKKIHFPYEPLTNEIKMIVEAGESTANLSFGKSRPINAKKLATQFPKSIAKNLLKNSVRLRCWYGDYVYKKGSGDQQMGYILKGKLLVINNGVIIQTLHAGDMFGEIAHVLKIPRTSDVVVGCDDTEIVLFSLNCLKRINNQRDEAIFWQYLCRLVAKRLLLTNHKLERASRKRNNGQVESVSVPVKSNRIYIR